MRNAGFMLALTAMARLAWAGPPADASNPALDLARTAVPARMAPRQSDHFVLLTDADLAKADAVLAMLETAYRSFHSGCESIGVAPGALPHRLVAVLFRDQQDYRRFIERHSPGVPDWVVGFYDPMTDRLVMFDQQSRVDVQKGLAAVDKGRARLERDVSAAGVSPAQLGQAGNQVDRARMQMDRDRQRIESDAWDDFLRTVAHEATHGIAFDSGVQVRSVAYPFWLSEGLATNIEPDHADDRDFGFHTDNPTRRRLFEQGLREGSLPRLADLVMFDAAPREERTGEVGRLYAASCHFTKWLARSRPSELRQYIEALRDGSWSDREARLAKFESIFGPVDALERSWMRAEARAWKALEATDMGRRLRDFERPVTPANRASDAPAPAAPTAAPEPPPVAPSSTPPASGG